MVVIGRNRFKKIILFGAILLIVLIIVIPLIYSSIKMEKIRNAKIPWILDTNYSGYLTMNSSIYNFYSKKSITTTVDGLRIYKISQKKIKLVSLSELIEREFVYETTEKEFIKKFIDATHEEIESTKHECVQLNDDTYHVIVIDNTFMRLGYFIFKHCKDGDEEYVRIYPYYNHEISIHYYSKKLLPIFKNELNCCKQ